MSGSKNGFASYKLPFFSNLQVSYEFDKLGRLNAANGTSGAGSFDYADNPGYRAWGALKHLEYGNGVEMNIGGFNNKLQATGFEVKKDSTPIIDKTYQFNSDGSVKFEDDNLNANFDRSYEYDHQARLTKALSGAAARNETITTTNTPYRKLHEYNAFGQIVASEVGNWSGTGLSNVSTAYVNNRRTEFGAYYDSDGRPIISGGAKKYAYNTLGQLEHTDFVEYNDAYPEGYVRQQEWIGYDGNGRIVRVNTSDQQGEDPPAEETYYKVRSSVLGGEVVYDTGPQMAFVFAGGDLLARQITNGVMWSHKDLSMNSYRSTGANGTVLGDGSGGVDWDKIETDPGGSSVGLSPPPAQYPEPANDLYASGWSFGLFRSGQHTVYSVDGIHVPPEFFASEMGRLGSSADIDCTRPELRIGQTGRVLSECFDTMTLARHGIFVLPYSGSTGDSPWPDDRTPYRDYAFEDEYGSLFDAPRRLYPNMDQLRGDVEARLKGKVGDVTCEQKLNALLEKMKAGFNFRDKVNAFLDGSDGHGIYQTSENINFLVRRNRKFVMGQRGKTYLAAPQAQIDGRIIVLNKRNFRNIDSQSVIHEVLHVASGSHQTIARVIADLEGLDSRAFANWEKANQGSLDKSDPNFGGPYSDLINAWIDKYCNDGSGGPGNWDRMTKEILR